MHLLFQDANAVGCRGNILLHRAVGSKILLIPPMPYETKGDVEGLGGKMKRYKQKLE